MSQPEVRSTQRLPYRCTHCARRRVRCNKNVPCDQCIRRGTADQCAREVVRIDGKLQIAREIIGSRLTETSGAHMENARLQSRVAQLELDLAAARGRNWAELGQRDSDPQSQYSTYREQLEDHEYVESTLDDWSFGRIEGHNASQTTLDAGATPDMAYALQILPDRAESTRVVYFALQKLTWIHCALDVEQAQIGHESFWDDKESSPYPTVDYYWLMLHLAILTIGYFSLSMIEGDTCANNSTNARKYYDATVKVLESSGTIKNPSIALVQTGAILSVCHNALGFVERARLLHGILISTARSLQMHHLADEQSHPKRLEGLSLWTTRSSREMGRRLWWTLVIIDWLESPRNYPLLDPKGFDTALAEADSDIAALVGTSTASIYSPTKSPIEHHIGMARLASIVYQHMTKQKATPNIIYRTLQEIDDLEEKQFGGRAKPEELLNDLYTTTTAQTDLHLWQRYNFAFALRFVSLNLCRFVLGPALHSETAEADIRDRARQTALEMSDLRNLNVPNLFNMTWNVCSATLAAGIFLAIDLISRTEPQPLGKTEQAKAAVLTCKNALRVSEGATVICRHGVVVLERLLRLQETRGGSAIDITHIIHNVTNKDEIPLPTTSDLPLCYGPDMQSPSVSLPEGMTIPIEELLSTNIDSGGLLDDFFQLPYSCDWVFDDSFEHQ